MALYCFSACFIVFKRLDDSFSFKSLNKDSLPFAFSPIEAGYFNALDWKRAPLDLSDKENQREIRFVRYHESKIAVPNPLEDDRVIRDCFGSPENCMVIHVPFAKESPANICGWKALDLRDGTFFIWGGSKTTAPSMHLDRSWVYNVKAKTVTEGPRAPIALRDPNLTLLRDGRVLITGGWRPSYGEKATNIMIYDRKTNSIKTLGTMCRPRCSHTVVELNNGEILIASGNTSKAFADTLDYLSASAEILDLKERKSTLIGNVREPRENAFAAAYGTKQAILFGGYKYLDDLSSTRYVVEPAELLNETR